MATLGRPKSDRKRQQILEAATDLFVNQGYANTNLEQVAAAAGVSKQTIYSHFSSKQHVLTAGIKRRCDENELTTETLDYAGAPDTFLREFAQRFIGFLLEDSSLRMYRLCLTESERHPEVGESFYQSGPRAVVEALAAYITLAKERGQLRVEHPSLAATQFLFMVKGLHVDTALLNLPESPLGITRELYIEQCCEMFLRAHAVG